MSQRLVVIYTAGTEVARLAALLPDVPRVDPDDATLAWEALPDAVLVVQGAEVVHANSAAAALVGEPSPVGLLGRRLLELFPAGEREEIGAALDRLLTGRLPAPPWPNLTLVRRDGGEREVEAAVAVLDQAAPRAFELVLHDVTAHRRAESALREADRRKTDFLAVLSHELRNALGPLRNGVHVLDRAPHESPQAERARAVVRRQTEHLARLVDDLLDVSRIIHGKLTLSRARLDARELVRRTVEDAQPLLDGRGIALGVSLCGGPVWVDADAARLEQVMTNLLLNAAKFTPPGGRVEVALSQAGGRCELRVRDTGAGIDPRLLDRIFEPFAQAGEGGCRQHGGMGIGLSLVRSLIEMHGGAVRALSEGKGRGAEFVVELPLAPAAG